VSDNRLGTGGENVIDGLAGAERCDWGGGGVRAEAHLDEAVV